MALTDNQLQDICIKLSEGNSLRKICRDMGVSESTARYNISKNEEYFAQSARARELGCDALADECLEIADSTEIDAADKRIRIDTRIRLIGKWSQRYGDKLTVDNNKTVTHKYDLDSLSNEKLDQLESILADAGRDQGGEVKAESSVIH